jgi:hypothetical protein
VVLAGLVASLAVAAVASPVLAGKPSGGSTTSTALRLVMVDASDTTVNHGDRITFAVSSSYAYPVVSVNCTQGGVMVYGDSRPLYQPNAFNDPGIYTLSSLAWTGGAASCTAALRVQKRNGVTTAATLSFGVAG